MQAGASYMLLNGQYVDIANLDLFKVLDRIRPEVRLLERLRVTGLSSIDITALSELRSSAAGTSVPESRLDLLSGSGRSDGGVTAHRITWFNDLEVDRMYKFWAPNVKSILQVCFQVRQMP